jgi:hypothetical protein
MSPNVADFRKLVRGRCLESFGPMQSPYMPPLPSKKPMP